MEYEASLNIKKKKKQYLISCHWNSMDNFEKEERVKKAVTMCSESLQISPMYFNCHEAKLRVDTKRAFKMQTKRYSYRLTSSRHPVTNHSRDRVYNEPRRGATTRVGQLMLIPLRGTVTS